MSPDPKSILLKTLPNAKVSSIIQLSSGHNNSTYTVTLNDKKVILKIYATKNKASIKEIKLLDYLNEKLPDLPIPKILKKLKTQEYVGILMKQLTGIPISQAKLSDFEKNKIFFQLGRLKAKINSIQYSSYGQFNSSGRVVNRFSKLSEMKKQDLDKVLKGLVKHNFPEAMIGAQRTLGRRILKIFDQDTTPCFCHGDTSLSNILISQDSKCWLITGIIDFEYAYSGGAASDFFSSPKNFNEFLVHKDALIEGYKHEAPVPKNWEDIIWASMWLRALQWLEVVPTMKWKDITGKAAALRQEKIKENMLSLIEKVHQRFS